MEKDGDSENSVPPLPSINAETSQDCSSLIDTDKGIVSEEAADYKPPLKQQKCALDDNRNMH